MRGSRGRALLLATVVLLAGCGAVAGPAGTPGPGGETRQATVIDVIDGDTLEIRFPNGDTDRVRLLGVDTPEVHVANDPAEYEGVPDTEAGAACLREAGHAASAFISERALGATVALVFDPVADRRGSYGRLLAYVRLDGRDLNRQLVAAGHARVYDSEFARAGDYYGLESTAQAEARGLWRCREPRAGDGPLTLVEVHADAEGDDREHLNDEYLVLGNAGDATLDLGGWTVADAAGHVYRFPNGTTLAPGARLTLHTGAGEDTADAVHWGADGPVWNNGGDTVVVRAANGTVVLERVYG